MMTRMVGLFPRDAFFHVHDGRYGDDEDGLLYGRGFVVCVVVKLGESPRIRCRGGVVFSYVIFCV